MEGKLDGKNTRSKVRTHNKLTVNERFRDLKVGEGNLEYPKIH